MKTALQNVQVSADRSTKWGGNEPQVYFANTVEDAMAMAREQLGVDAMLVNSRKASPDSRHLELTKWSSSATCPR